MDDPASGEEFYSGFEPYFPLLVIVVAVLLIE